MKMKRFFLACLMILCGYLGSHDGHGGEKNIWHQIGQWHFAFLHFPIALITMTVVAELLSVWTRNILYDYASYFMLMSAAFVVIPTMLFGLALGYSISDSYVGISTVIYPWHMYFGILTAILVVLTAGLRNMTGTFGSVYLYFLILSFFSMSATGFLGGSLSFGIGLS